MKSLNSYLRRAWDDLSSDEGWWRVILVLGLLNCVPLVGQVFMLGYIAEWAKEASWGMKGGLSHDSGDISRRVKYGFMVLGVLIIWIAPILIVAELLRFIPIMGDVLCFLVELLALFVSAIASAAALRSIIYERMMPGLQFGRVLKMARRDAGGLFQAFAICLLNLVLLVAALFVVLLPAIPFVASVVFSTPELILGSDLIIVVLLGMLTIVVALVVWVAGAVVSTLIFALYGRALGYWMEQFEPRLWKSPADKMPFEIQMEEEKKAKAEAKAKAKAEKRARKTEEAKDKADTQQLDAKDPAEPDNDTSPAESNDETNPVEPDVVMDTAADGQLVTAAPADEPQPQNDVDQAVVTASAEEPEPQNDVDNDVTEVD